MKEQQGGTAPRQQEQQILQLQVWPRRQEMPPQQVTTGPTLMEGVKRTNTVVRNQGQKIGWPRRNPYAIDIDKGRNCYAYRGFGHIA